MKAPQPTTAARLARQALATTALASALLLAGCGDSPESLLAKAKESIEKNEPKAAEIHLKNLLQTADNAEARFLLGTVHLQNYDLRSAEKELRRAQEQGFDPARLALPLATTLSRLGEHQKAIDEAATATPTSAQDKARLATLVGRSHLALGKPDEARKSFESGVAADPDHAPARAGLITLQAAGGDLPGASAAVDELLAKSPNDAAALTLKGDLELAQGRRAEAREFFAKAAAADPQDRFLHGKIAGIAIELGDFEGAQKAIDSQRKLTGPAALPMYLQALLHSRQGKHAEARQAIEQSLKASPNYLPAQALGAQIYLQVDAPEQAERLARRVIDAAPNSTRGYLLLASAQLRLNSPGNALKTLQGVIDRGANDPAVYALAGEAALRGNDAAKSAAFFAKSVALDPKDPRKQTGLALAHLAGGDRERGLAELERITEQAGSGLQADFALITAQLRDRQFDKALASIARLESKQPQNAMAANLRASALLGKGDAAGARKALEEALKRDPKFLPATANLAALDLRDKKPEAAKKRFSDLLQIDAKNIAAMLALADLTERTASREDRKKAADEALALLKKARETDKASVPANLALAAWYVRQDRAKEAIPQLQEALNANPNNVQLLDALGTAYLRTDQATVGMETLERILQARPNDAMLQLRMGQLKLSRNDIQGAMANFRKAAELQPKALEPKLAMAAAHVRAGRPEDARRVANALQAEAPKNPAGFLLKGDIAMSEGKFADAAAEFRKALALEKAPPIQLKLHQAVAAGGNLAEADGMLGTMIRERPDDLVLRAYAGEHEIGRKRWNEAIAHYEHLLSRQPQNVLALNNAAWAMHEAKSPKALETAEKALAAAPDTPAVQDTAGVILMEAGKTERGLELLRKAASGAPKAASIRLHLAEALVKTGDKAGARAELDKLLLDNPQGPVAERARELQKQL